MAKMLNLGCGSRFHPDWVNVNFTTTGEGVIAVNLCKGIPFPDQSFDFVYHSHLLEHFSKLAAVDFLLECFRVLKPSGILRVVVPDLETIARNYLLALKKVKTGLESWDHNYDWMLLEMYDQVVRNQSGGEMARYLYNKDITNEQFVVDRCGVEIKSIIEMARKNKINPHTGKQPKVVQIKKIARAIYNPKAWLEGLIRLLLGDEYHALQIGRFRLSGEIHQWMYDSYSLGKIFADCGFGNVMVRNAKESFIAEWQRYHLDTEPDGSVYKPDSLFIEAIKP